MIRQQKRARLREIDKELSKIYKHKEFNRLVVKFKDLSGANAELLKKGEHPDKRTQSEFNLWKAYIEVIAKLEMHQKFLLGESKEYAGFRDKV
jgi:hypothetical protein